ncbi:MAG: hypothetical protein GF329_20490 [Candidatus Lokiarchaeota archaeon]|nr:hypothetical protein [Candidatus Lokiarchaeota archaeon]
MKKEYDVIIIGSGPAGSASGIVLGRSGQLKVLMIDKKKLPRHKICSGMVSRSAQNALKKIGLDIPEVICTRPKKGKGIKIQFKIGNDLLEIPERYLNVWRRDFDYWLNIEANKLSVKIKDESELIDIIKEDEKLKARIRYKDQKSSKWKIKEYITKYVIGADGGTSKTRKIIYPEFKRETAIAYQEYWKGKINIDPQYFHAFMDRELSAGYAFCNKKEDQIIIGVGAEKGNRIKVYQKKFIQYLEKGWGLQLDTFIRSEGCASTNIFREEPIFNHLHGKNNTLLVGEAADLFNIMGEGIPSAIKSGKSAAESILKNIDHPSMDVVEIYREKNKKLVKKLKKNWEGYYKRYETFTQI